MYRQPATRTGGDRQRCLYCGIERRFGEECFSCKILVPPEASAHYRASFCSRCLNPNLEHVGLGPTGAEVDHCQACHGVFASSGAWTALFDAIAVGEAIDMTRCNGAPASYSLLPLVHCPVCRYEMERARFGKQADLVIDVCNQHGVWLDPTELAFLVRLLQHGPRP